ncbi:DNA topoisomerase IB [Dyella sp. C11]|uniref:DNA topoisomerase IB n=1 Tax=Dyella sp. C11 TaxID=2126991 RepID=UPI000D64F563|nr:DNA topoisomerase IB [Dyella sp. C11]
MTRRMTPPERDAASEGLVYVHDGEPGLHRRRRGKGFIYVDARGRRVTRPSVIERIHALAIPPAYADVWICANPRGHLQATGRDARGRKQYRYHSRWRQVRDESKFSHVSEFGALLPRIRRRVRTDLALPGWPREKVVALIVRLLDETLIRVGNEAYTKDNGSYGLTTLRSRHVRIDAGELHLCFRAKSGQWSEVALNNDRLARLLRRLQQLPGQRVFQYVDDDGKRHAIDSGMVNDYLREASGSDFTAKDFRTWAGTVMAVGLLAETHVPSTATDKAKQEAINDVVREVAAQLRNTPKVCRTSYIHPKAFTGWEDGSLHRRIPASLAHHPRKLERATLRFLSQRSRAT